MISAIQWIRKGAAAQHPKKYDLNEEEYARISKLAAEQLEDAKEDLKAAEAMAVDSSKSAETKQEKEEEDEMAQYNLDNYDAEVEASNKKVGIFSNIKDLAFYDNDEEDPYVTLKQNVDEEEEKKELEILPTDNMLLAAKTEDDISQLEVHVYEEGQENIYVHHDIMLPSFPLCLEWLDFHSSSEKIDATTSGNYVAIGTFEPDIEIWDLDTVDVMFPETILGHTDKTKKRSKKVNDKYHVDAIMDLSWNKNHRNFLLSSSADGTVKLWDLTTSQCVQSYHHHQDKVQSVAWHPTEATVFLSGSYDKTVCVLDARSPNQVTRWSLSSDVESLRWDPHFPNHFYVALENGMIQYFDVRNAQNGQGGKPLFTIQAHDEAVSAFDINPLIPGCIATGSTDKIIKIWSTVDNKPSMVTSRNFELGRIFSTQFCPDSPFQLAIAGSNGKMHVWDMASNAGVRQSFRHQSLAGLVATEEKKPVTTIDDNEEDDDMDDDEPLQGEDVNEDEEDMEEDSD
ncbi:putative WD repeat-containing protein C17D11.16 [Choanephora cucurbitarum]|uniref:Putative WD repeat-containing protein C17D11.16 n=1 Tax=Choanephora cucurbitarum TaxID=101091 RepID=A0A1C7N7E1_9FUNG|nr:putative WD repeat-containing protein C17D11.16 [Choanephora cucurbitarum]